MRQETGDRRQGTGYRRQGTGDRRRHVHQHLSEGGAHLQQHHDVRVSHHLVDARLSLHVPQHVRVPPRLLLVDHLDGHLDTDEDIWDMRPPSLNTGLQWQSGVLQSEDRWFKPRLR